MAIGKVDNGQRVNSERPNSDVANSPRLVEGDSPGNVAETTDRNPDKKPRSASRLTRLWVWSGWNPLQAIFTGVGLIGLAYALIQTAHNYDLALTAYKDARDASLEANRLMRESTRARIIVAEPRGEPSVGHEETIISFRVENAGSGLASELIPTFNLQSGASYRFPSAFTALFQINPPSSLKPGEEKICSPMTGDGLPDAQTDAVLRSNGRLATYLTVRARYLDQFGAKHSTFEVFVWRARHSWSVCQERQCQDATARENN